MTRLVPNIELQGQASNPGGPNEWTPGAPIICATRRGVLTTGSKTLLGNYISPQMFGAKGDGVTDDTAALQAAINAASARYGNGVPLFIPPGYYKITSALVVKSDTVIFGNGPQLNSTFTGATVIAPSGCRAFTMDGSLYPADGNNVFRNEMRNITVDCVNASDATCGGIYINQAYTVNLRNVSVYHVPNAATRGIYITGVSNHIVLDTVIAYGANPYSGNTGTGIEVNGSSVRMYSPDVEGFQAAGGKALVFSGSNCWVDLYGIRVETSDTNFYHNITSGQINVYGSNLLGGPSNTQTFYINADNLSLYGVFFPLAGSNLLFNIAKKGLKRILIYNCLSGWNTMVGVFNNGADLSGVQLLPDMQPFAMRNVVSFQNTVMVSAQGYDILWLGNFATGAMFRLRFVAIIGPVACSAYELNFVIGGNTAASGVSDTATGATIIAGVLAAPASNGMFWEEKGRFSNANWAVTVAKPTIRITGNTAVINIVPTAGGALGPGNTITVQGSVEVVGYDPSGGANIAVSGAAFTGTTATSVLTVASVQSGSLGIGQVITMAGVAGGTYITSLGTGTGGTGTYNLSTSPGTLSSRTGTAV